MEPKKLNQILKDHELWLLDPTKGKRANLCNANLRYADLSNADLYRADLRYANLSNSDLRYADLRYANLRGANLDCSCWPLWCGSLNAIIDDRIKAQLLYHFLSVAPEFKTKRLVKFANTFHRIPEVPKLKENKK